MGKPRKTTEYCATLRKDWLESECLSWNCAGAH